MTSHVLMKESQRMAGRILIVAPQWIGDCVMAEPLIARLRQQHPASFISVIALKHIAPILRAIPVVDEVIEVPFAHGKLQWGDRRKLARDLNARHFNVAYILPNSLKSALLPWMAGIPRRVGYLGENRYGLLTTRLPNPKDKHALMTEFYAQLAGPLKADEPLTQPALQVDPKRRFSACDLHGVKLDVPYIILAPGAEYGPAKQWPLEHFREIAIFASTQQFATLVMGGAKDKEAGEKITAGLPLTKNLCGETSLDDAIAIISGAEGAISNDSGLMHVAAALMVPTVGIYGSTSPHHTPPSAHRSATLWIGPRGAYEQEGISCSPCFARACRYEGDDHLRCLKRISPELAWSTLRQL